MTDVESRAEQDPVAAPTERRRKLAEQLAARLLNQITEKNLPPGTPLEPQTEMLENFDVGKGSLREALRFLEMHGFIELRAGRKGGPVVGDLTMRNFGRMSNMYFHAFGITVGQVMEARLVLEPAMVRAITERGLGAVDRARLAAFGASGGCDRTAPSEAGHPATLDFHWSIAELSGNGVLQMLAESTRGIYAGVGRELVVEPAELADIADVHSTIADVMLAGDAPRAQELMAEHLRAVMSVYEDHPHLLSSRIPWP